MDHIGAVLFYFLSKKLCIDFNLLIWFFRIKIHELSDLKETYSVITLDDERGLEWLEWSDDGQLLAVATPTGLY